MQYPSIKLRHVLLLAGLLASGVPVSADRYEDVRSKTPDLRSEAKVVANNRPSSIPKPFLSLLNFITLLQSGQSPKADSGGPSAGVGVFDESYWNEANYE